MHLVVAHLARRDLQAIARYSEKEWGAARKAQYMAAIREKFSLLLQRPAIGATRNDIAPGYRSYPVGRHLIFYRIEEKSVVILRVLHQRMDVRLHF
jgi:toxin ParE1/3/4